MSRLAIGGSPEPVLTALRSGIDHDGLVYFLTVNRLQRYQKGSSRIVYIGSTKGGFGRVFASAAEEIYDVKKRLDDDFERLEAFTIWCDGAGDTKNISDRSIPRILERAALIVFRELYGTVPKLNEVGDRLRAEDEFDLFSKDHLTTLIKRDGEDRPEWSP